MGATLPDLPSRYVFPHWNLRHDATVALISDDPQQARPYLTAYHRGGVTLTGAHRGAPSRGSLAAAPSRSGDDWPLTIEPKRPDVVDVYLPPGRQRLKLIRAAATAGCDVLISSPLEEDYDEWRDVVHHCNDAGVLLALRQPALWSPAIAGLNGLMRDGWLGAPTSGSVEVSLPISQCEALNGRFFDALSLIRGWFPGDCVRVESRFPPECAASPELDWHVTLGFLNGERARVRLRCGPGLGETWAVRLARAGRSLRAVEDWSGRRAAPRVEIRSRRPAQDAVIKLPRRTLWRRHLHPLFDLLAARRQGRMPDSAAHRALPTATLFAAAQRSAAEGRPVCPVETDRHRYPR